MYEGSSFDHFIKNYKEGEDGLKKCEKLNVGILHLNLRSKLKYVVKN